MHTATTRPQLTTSTRCPTYNNNSHTYPIHTPYHAYVAFVLLTQNSYVNHWDTILYQSTQIHITHLNQAPHTTIQHHTPLLHPASSPLTYTFKQPNPLPSPVQPAHNDLSPTLAIPQYAIVAVLKHLEILSREKRQRNNHILHNTIFLRITTHPRRLVLTT